MVTSPIQKALKLASALRDEHGLLRAAGMLMLRAAARLSGGTVLACMHKRVEDEGTSAACLLTRQQIERASQDPAMDLPPAFVAAERSPCYGVVIDDRVRSYVWTSSEEVRAVPGTMVRMSPGATYVFKAFTDPLFRRRGLLRECLRAIEHDGARHDKLEMTSLVEVHNRNSLRAFRNAGFERCGFVVVSRWPWAVRRIGCRAVVPCAWCKHGEIAPVSTVRSSVAASSPRD